MEMRREGAGGSEGRRGVRRRGDGGSVGRPMVKREIPELQWEWERDD